MRGLLTLRTLSTPEIMDIIELAIRFKKGWSINFPGKKMVNLFYENSTRTQYSFQMAMINLGITPLSFNLASSSVQKGETLYDTVRTFEALGVDGIVIRHTKDVYYNDLQTIKVPIFNGGDGTSDHPTQTLLDLMTIYEEFGAFEGLKIALVGDISHSRVAHGNSEVMKRLGMKVFVSGPEQFCDKTGEYIPLDEAVEKNGYHQPAEGTIRTPRTGDEYHKGRIPQKVRLDLGKSGAHEKERHHHAPRADQPRNRDSFRSRRVRKIQDL